LAPVERREAEPVEADATVFRAAEIAIRRLGQDLDRGEGRPASAVHRKKPEQKRIEKVVDRIILCSSPLHCRSLHGNAGFTPSMRRREAGPSR